MAPKGQDALLPFIGLPIVPLCSGRLASLSPSHSCTLLNLRSGKAGPMEASFRNTLQALGLELVDDDSFSLPLRDRQQQKDKLLLVPGYCHSGDAAGILAALRIVALQSLARPSPTAAAVAGGGRTNAVLAPNRVLNMNEVLEVRLMFAGRMAGLTVKQRRALRGFLLKDPELPQTIKDGGRSSDGVTLKQILSWLPLYESAASAVSNDASESAVLAALSSTQSLAIGHTLPPFQDLAGPLCAQNTSSDLVSFYMAPNRIEPKVLSAKFLANRHSAESRVMRDHLGVGEMQPTEAYQFYILPTIASHEPALRDAVVLQMLQNLPNLIQTDKSFQDFLGQVSFLPNRRVRDVQ